MSDESDFEIMSSQPEKQVFSSAPEDIIFKFKVQPLVGSLRKFGYRLKEGTNLPYTSFTGGFHIKFSTSLEPSVAGYRCELIDNKWEMTEEFDVETLDENDAIQEGSTLLTTSVLQCSFDVVNLDSTRIHNYKCPLCDFVYERPDACEMHVAGEHPNWKADLIEAKKAVSSLPSPSFSSLMSSPRQSTSGSTPFVSSRGISTSPSSICSSPAPSSQHAVDLATTPTRSTPHTNPSWLKDMKKNFKHVVIEKCSRQVKDAVENNTLISDVRTKKEVRNSIINETVTCLLEIFGGVGKPGVAQMRELVSEMGFLYPGMFKDDDAGFGYGLGGGKGNSGLANQMLDRFRSRTVEARKKILLDGDEIVLNASVDKKKGKKKSIYGVDNDLWYGPKPTAISATSISQVNDETSFEKREQVYQENRPELIAQFRDSRKAIPNTCRGFFVDYRHLEEHFKVLTSSAGLTVAVEENLKQQMSHLEAYLCHSIKTVDFAEFLSGLDVACHAEYNGSFLYKYIELLRRAGDHFDKKGAVLLRLKEEPPTTDSPHVVAVCVDRTWIFEVWVDRMKLLGDLSLAQAIASFLHLAFVFDLQYPKESQTLADIWQRKFAKYGDLTGTKTHSKKDSAQAKMNRYVMVLGELLTQ